ncbi:MAG TPA: phosphoribosylglycinamide formyltransferase [Gemmatimonadales bacterium]|nr:phosphoribosylglycinamide formyltransferase [Gemmatimonadales bacterium]
MTTRIAVLASGGGSNLQALFDYHSRLAERRNGTLVLVASDRAAAKALDRARVAGVATEVIGNPDDGESLCEMLEAHRAELIVLAGYLRLVPTAVVDRWSNRIVNVHPALLPSFGGKGMYGMRVHRAVLESGARISGPTVHIVDAEYDRGRILSQWPVPVLGNDTPESLAARVLRAEHMLLPRVVELLAAELSGKFQPAPETVHAEFRFVRGDAADGGPDSAMGVEADEEFDTPQATASIGESDSSQTSASIASFLAATCIMPSGA